MRGRPAPGRRPPTLFIVLALTATGMALFALVVAQVFLGQSSFRQSNLESIVNQKRLATEQLELEVAKLASPSRIAQRAQQIGLVPAPDVVVLTPPTTRSGPSQTREGR
ncbi:MAG TPA: hypothetical protein VKV69_04815 [Actinomycetota bacterium]|nr:hypothetical protein [Actinomycetota bacterium]